MRGRTRRLLSFALVFLLGVAFGRCNAPQVPLGPDESLAPSERADAAPPSALPPDQILVTSDQTGGSEIYTLNADGSLGRKLTADPQYNSRWPRVSPDRRTIFFYRSPKASQPQDYTQTSLWAMDGDGANLRVLRPRRADGWDVQGHAEPSPDGQRLVMFGGPGLNPQIFVTDAVGKAPRQVTNRPALNIDPSWSPDGQTILFIGCASFICFEKDYEVFTVPAAGGDATQLTSNSVRDNDPYYSPDGRRIAWIAETEPNAFVRGLGVWNIFLMEADGSNTRKLTNDREISAVPQWSEDGSRIYFHRFEPGKQDRWAVFAVKPEGGELVPITRDLSSNYEDPSP